MPVLDEMTYLLKKTSSSQANVSADKTSKSNSRVSLKLPNGVIHAPATPDLDLLDLSSDDNPANTSSSNDYLHDLLGIGLTNTESTGFSIFSSLLIPLYNKICALMLLSFCVRIAYS